MKILAHKLTEEKVGKIQTKNDGKGKHQSWEATIELEGNCEDSYYTFNAVAWGSSECEAVGKLLRIMQQATNSITENSV